MLWRLFKYITENRVCKLNGGLKKGERTKQFLSPTVVQFQIMIKNRSVLIFFLGIYILNPIISFWKKIQKKSRPVEAAADFRGWILIKAAESRNKLRGRFTPI